MNRKELLLGAAAAGGAALLLGAAKADGGVLVAFVIGKYANVMDIAGPWEALQDTSATGADGKTTYPFRLFTVSDSKNPVEIAGSINAIPNATYDDAPQPNIIVMGAQGEHTPKKIAWIQSAAVKADVVMSVCTGAFLLAKTGLLDGKRATTHHDFYDKFEKQFPKVSLVRGPRFVDDGKFLTAGGLTSGIELGLHVAERYFGRTAADESAAYMEYNRSPKRPIG